MSDYTIRDRGGNVVGYFSDSTGAGCAGCIGLSIIICVVYGMFCFYQIVLARIANNKIEAQRVVLKSDMLDVYTGEYKYTRYKIKIERRGDKLYNKSAEEFCELVPVSPQEFIYKACANGFQGKGRFERDERGRLFLVIIHRDGRTERAAKAD